MANSDNLTRKGLGRPKGIQNKTTRAAKEAIQDAFDGIGGVEALIVWAMKPKNRSLFYSSIYPKVMPLQLNHTGTIDITDKLKEARERAANR